MWRQAPNMEYILEQRPIAVYFIDDKQVPMAMDKNSPAYSYALYGAVGFQFAVSVVAGLIFGNYLDKKLGTLPWLTIIGLALGFVGGLVNLVRILGWLGRIKDKNEKG